MPIETTIAARLIERGWRLALAETTTGGLISVRFVRLPGSSAYFDRGIVAYSQAAKVQALGIDPDVTQAYGVVSVESVRAMAVGLQRISRLTWFWLRRVSPGRFAGALPSRWG